VTTEPPVLLVVAGPAGSGKSTLCDRLVAEVPGVVRIVTTTTRAPRPGEINGLHYHFLTPEQFDAKLAENAFLEWAWVHGKRRYGTLARSVLDPLERGQSLVISVDVQGVESFRRAAAVHPLIGRRMTTVFIRVDRERLVARMRARASDDEAEIAGRMRTAERELQEADKFDFVIDSRTRDEDFAALLEILKKARARAAGS
jgi:guanylate kinase